MTQILKFRLLDVKNNKFWIEGKGWDVYSLFVSYREQLADKTHFRLVQFTGLFDKNGKEIYEGDIVKYAPFNSSCHGKAGIPYENGVVSRSKYGTWVINGIKQYQKEMPFDNSFTGKKSQFEDEEVVGNIFENPERVKA